MYHAYIRLYAPKGTLGGIYTNHTVRPSVRLSVHPALCPEHISYIFVVGTQILCVDASWEGGVLCIGFWFTLTLAYFLELSCQEHIYFIIWGRNPKFVVWMHLWVLICRGPFSGHWDLDLWPSFLNNRVWSILPILHVFEAVVPKLVCGFLLGWGSSAYHFANYQWL